MDFFSRWWRLAGQLNHSSSLPGFAFGYLKVSNISKVVTLSQALLMWKVVASRALNVLQVEIAGDAGNADAAGTADTASHQQISPLILYSAVVCICWSVTSTEY